MFKITTAWLPHALSIRLVSGVVALSLWEVTWESEVGCSHSRLVSTQQLCRGCLQVTLGLTQPYGAWYFSFPGSLGSLFQGLPALTRGSRKKHGHLLTCLLPPITPCPSAEFWLLCTLCPASPPPLHLPGHRVQAATSDHNSSFSLVHRDPWAILESARGIRQSASQTTLLCLGSSVKASCSLVPA